MSAPLSPQAFNASFTEAKRLHFEGHFDRARHIYQDIAARNPAEPAPHMMLAELDMRDGRLVTARKRLEAVIEQHPHLKAPRTALAGLAEELADAPVALALYRQEVDEAPGDPGAQARLATVLRLYGRLDEAKAMFERLAKDWPEASGGYLGLAAIDEAALTEEHIAKMKTMAEAPKTSLPERVQLYFALGDVWDRQKEYDKAFAAYDTANRLRRENLHEPFDDPVARSLMPKTPDTPTTVAQAEAELKAFLGGMREMFTKEYIAHFSGGGLTTDAPIFIVGMPRSGSTLLEQILSSHPQVTGLGETKALSHSFRKLMPVSRAQITEDFKRTFYRRVGETYLEAMRERGWNGQGRVIDKMLGNFANVGIIHLAFPNAVIINSMRDPVDTCFSCFRQTFKDRNETTYDLGAVGRQYVMYRQTLDHWQKVLPGRVHNVQHEALLADPEAEIRKLLVACRLEWNDACLRFYETDRPVRTASASQVRHPLFKTSVARWKPYVQYLTPLIEALGPYGPH